MVHHRRFAAKQSTLAPQAGPHCLSSIRMEVKTQSEERVE